MAAFFNKGPGGKYVRLGGLYSLCWNGFTQQCTEQATRENTTAKSVAASYQTSVMDIIFLFKNYLFRLFISGCAGSLLLCVWCFSSCGAHASPCSGFSCWGARAVGTWAQ